MNFGDTFTAKYVETADYEGAVFVTGNGLKGYLVDIQPIYFVDIYFSPDTIKFFGRTFLEKNTILDQTITSHHKIVGGEYDWTHDGGAERLRVKLYY